MKYFVFFLVVSFAYVATAAKCPGCVEEDDVNNKQANEMLIKLLTQENTKRNGEAIKVDNVKKINKQIVAGVKYNVEFLGKGERSSKNYDCTCSFLLQAWLSPDPQLLDFNCKEV